MTNSYVCRHAEALEAAALNQSLFAEFNDRLHDACVALGLPADVRFMRVGMGSSAWISGIQTSDGTAPDGWHSQDGKTTLVPDESTPAGTAAAIVLEGLGEIPNPRQVVEQFGMPAIAYMSVGEDVRIQVPAVRIEADAISVVWQSEPLGVEIDERYWAPLQ